MLKYFFLNNSFLTNSSRSDTKIASSTGVINENRGTNIRLHIQCASLGRNITYLTNNIVLIYITKTLKNNYNICLGNKVN